MPRDAKEMVSQRTPTIDATNTAALARNADAKLNGLIRDNARSLGDPSDCAGTGNDLRHFGHAAVAVVSGNSIGVPQNGHFNVQDTNRLHEKDGWGNARSPQ
jgi:hypothetical protein